MAIQDRLTVTPRHERRVSDFQSITLTESMQPTDAFAMDLLDKYTLKATLHADFWADAENYINSKRIAERAIMHDLFSDTHKPLIHLLRALSDGDRKAAFAAANELCLLVGMH